MDKILLSILFLGLSTYGWAWLITSIDHFEREPFSYTLSTFLWGAIPGLGLSFFSQSILISALDNGLGSGLISQLLGSAVIAPWSEEVTKGIAIAILYCFFQHEFDGWVDGIVYGAIAGLGFNFTEDLPGLILTSNWSAWGTLLVSDVINGGSHAFYTALTGIGFGIARYSKNFKQKSLAIGGGLLAAITAHGINNGSVVMISHYFHTNQASFFDWIYLLNYWGLGCLLLLLWFVADRVERLRLQIYLSDEVPEVIDPQLYAHLCGEGIQALSDLGLTPRQRAVFVQTVAELAQKKFQLQTMDENRRAAEIQILRETLKQMFV